MQDVHVDEAYYWTDSDGSLKLALRQQSSSLLGRAWDMDWQMSVVLEGLPAGSERLYRLGPIAIRVIQDFGGDHRRSSSAMGVAVVQQPRNHRLKGRLHVTVHQQQFGVLSGWVPVLYRAPLLVLVAEFEAVENSAKGREILTHTETDGFERRANPATMPARMPTTIAP